MSEEKTEEFYMRSPFYGKTLPKMIAMIIAQFRNNDFYCDDLFVDLIRSAKGTDDYPIIVDMVEAAKERASNIITLHEIKSNDDIDATLLKKDPNIIGAAYNFLGNTHLLYEPNFEKAIDCYKKAAELKHSMAITSLGHMYKHGNECLKKDVEKARQYYKDAVDLGNLDAMASLARDLHSQGEHEEALKIQNKAARLGHKHSNRALGELYEKGIDGVVADPEKATEFYQKAIEQGDPEAMVFYARMLYKHDPLKNLDEISALYEEAMKLGSIDAMYELEDLNSRIGLSGHFSAEEVSIERKRLLNERLLINPDDYIAKLELGIIYRKEHNYFRAIECFNAVSRAEEVEKASKVEALSELLVIYEEYSGAFSPEEVSDARKRFCKEILLIEVGEKKLHESLKNLKDSYTVGIENFDLAGSPEKKDEYGEKAFVLSKIYNSKSFNNQTKSVFFLEKARMNLTQLTPELNYSIEKSFWYPEKIGCEILLELLWNDILLKGDISDSTL